MAVWEISCTLGNMNKAKGHANHCTIQYIFLRLLNMLPNYISYIILCHQEFIRICKVRDSESISKGLPIMVGDSQEDCQSPVELGKR